MPDRDNVIESLNWVINDIEENGHYQVEYYANEIRKALALLKEQDYRSWMIDMLHKYGRDELISIMVQKGEETLLAELLKEQEAVEPLKQTEQTEWTVCGNCHKHIISKWTFCPYCGREVEWE